MPGNGLGNNRKNTSGSGEKFGVERMRLCESGNIGVSGNDVETTGTMRRGVVKSWSQVNKAS